MVVVIRTVRVCPGLRQLAFTVSACPAKLAEPANGIAGLAEQVAGAAVMVAVPGTRLGLRVSVTTRSKAVVLFTVLVALIVRS